MEERTCIKCGKTFPLTSEYFHYRNKANDNVAKCRSLDYQIGGASC